MGHRTGYPAPVQYTYKCVEKEYGMNDRFYRVYIAIYFYYSLLTVSQVCVVTHFGYKVTNS
jgi:hypothetical protein